MGEAGPKWKVEKSVLIVDDGKKNVPSRKDPRCDASGVNAKAGRHQTQGHVGAPWWLSQ